MSSLRQGKLSHVKVDDGLLIVGFPLNAPRTRLSSRLLPRRYTGDVAKLTDRSAEIAQGIIDPSTNETHFITDRLYPGFLPGMSPMFWSPLPAGVLKALFFGDVYCASWFNPLHLVRKLENAGFRVETGRRGFPEVLSKPLRGRTASMHVTSSTMKLLTQHLLPEREFVAMISRMFEKVRDADLPPDAQIRIPILHFYGGVPPVLPKKYRRKRRRAASLQESGGADRP